ncbi:hypothetical protein ML401_28555 [Bradyrhizobium sp. 62B]|uniref:hypothetical protein n=1 Tax=Bradyrhizobium sp. 62B TaxID=2898442 RepID=UPI002557E49E|nr:hypothetical protein ML401_28555 [Bradyrhizobium sp. 62B]
MKIRTHSESHIVELEDGSRWQIFPGDLDLTLGWKPETDLTVVESEDEVATHELLGGGARVRVKPVGGRGQGRAQRPLKRLQPRATTRLDKAGLGQLFTTLPAACRGLSGMRQGKSDAASSGRRAAMAVSP